MRLAMWGRSSTGVRARCPAEKLAKCSGAPRSAFCVRYAMAARKWRNSARSRSTSVKDVAVQREGKSSPLLPPEHEEHGAAQTHTGPEVVQPHRFLHIEGRKRNEDAQGDDLL